MTIDDLVSLRNSIKLGRWITIDQQKLLDELGIEVFDFPTNDRLMRQLQVENVKWKIDKVIAKQQRYDRRLKIVAYWTAWYLVACYVMLIVERVR